ncbi:metallophosphoesterase family protein [Clostridium mediterraneense]|uniref:metallophosphoesterase family protein n=1 Tax=Clostridium mediterraneense TaxID=1805472 RepID=UPI000835B391|nr:metallophosphoesterase [Clostridium mediterraneense]
MSKLKWLHLSDLHYCFEGYYSQWARDRLLDKIKELTEIKYIFITGDLLYQFKNNFSEISVFIEEIMNFTGVDKKNVIIVPGNHDFPRGTLRTNTIKGLLNSEEKVSEIVSKCAQEIQDFLINDYKSFFEFYEKLLGKKEKWNELHFISEFDDCIIVSLNTCLISGLENEEGTLSINLDKLFKVLRSIKESNKPKIAIGHHSIECFDESEREKIIQMFDDYGIDLYLCGHMHKSKYKIYSDQCRSIHSFVCGAGMVDDYADPSFIIGEINLESYKCNIKYYCWDKDLNKWCESNNISRKMIDGDGINFDLDRLVEIKEKGIIEIPNSIDKRIDDILKVNVVGSKFQKFLLDFCKNIQEYNEEGENTKAVDVEEKFEKMRCTLDFQMEFDNNVEYFGVINNIFKDPSYISYDKKTVIPGVIRSVYRKAFSICENGDEIIDKMIDILCDEYEEMISIPRLELEQYFRTIIYWSIDKCTIYNDRK